MSSLKQRLLCDRVTWHPADHWTPEGRLRISIKPTPEQEYAQRNKRIKWGGSEVQLTPSPMMTKFGLGFTGPRSGKNPLDVTYGNLDGSVANIAAGATYTSGAIACGSAAGDRRVFACVGVRWAGSDAQNELDTMTIGGVATTVHKKTGVGLGRVVQAAIHSAILTTGTTCVVVLTNPAGAATTANYAVAIYYAYNVDAAQSDDAENSTTGTGAMTLDCDTTINSIGLGIFYCAGTATTTWVGLTEDQDTLVESASARFSTASADINTAAAPRTINATASIATTLAVACVCIFV